MQRNLPGSLLHLRRAEQSFDLVVIGHIESRLAVLVLHSDMFHRPVRSDKLTDDVRLPVDGCTTQGSISNSVL